LDLLPSFSGMGFVVGGWITVVLPEREMYIEALFCWGFDFGDFFSVFLRLRRGSNLLCASLGSL